MTFRIRLRLTAQTDLLTVRYPSPGESRPTAQRAEVFFSRDLNFYRQAIQLYLPPVNR